MKKYLIYLKYVIKHKWYVMIECFKCGLIWRGLMHDMSKFRPSEFIPYANFFYGKPKVRKKGYYKATNSGDDNFDRAWLDHIHCNKHHWQHWVLQEDEGNVFCLKMPYKYVLEMVCDWIGAGKAQNSELSCHEWYKAHKHKMHFHDSTKKDLEFLLQEEKYNKSRKS